MQQEILQVTQVAFVGLVQYMYGMATEHCKLCRTDSWSLHRSFGLLYLQWPKVEKLNPLLGLKNNFTAF
jgi:hypothetical protein